MKAIRVHQFGGPEVLQMQDLPVPEPDTDEVLVRIKAIGVNPVETYWRAGLNATLPLPYTPGTDAAGIVEKIGSTVTNVKRGDRVYTSATRTGAYAEFTVCKAENAHRLANAVSFAQGAAVNIPYATAYRALFQRGQAVPGETVLIHGATGGVGIAATQLARAAGLVAIATGGSDKGREMVRDHGAHHVLDHRAAGYLQEAMALTNGRGVDLILEMLANVNLGKDLSALAPRGRVVVIGSRGNVEITPRDLMAREADVRGLMLFTATRVELRSIHAALAAGLENGTLRPVVRKELPLADAAKAHEAVMAPGALGKIVLVP